jgi:hypothetical protein
MLKGSMRIYNDKSIVEMDLNLSDPERIDGKSGGMAGMRR